MCLQVTLYHTASNHAPITLHYHGYKPSKHVPSQLSPTRSGFCAASSRFLSDLSDEIREADRAVIEARDNFNAAMNDGLLVTVKTEPEEVKEEAERDDFDVTMMGDTHHMGSGSADKTEPDEEDGPKAEPVDMMEETREATLSADVKVKVEA
eukprot:Polyplicarium_translucidae@DN3403_c1_g2_i1.p1